MNGTDSVRGGGPAEERDHTNQIVVGIDGSPSSRAALDCAARQAAGRGLGLLLLHAPSMPVFAAPFGHPVPATPSPDVVDRAERLLRQAVDHVARTHTDLSVQTSVSSLGPEPALLAAARTASIVVVGARGMGGFTSALLGSVSIRLSAHAACPVAVVPEPAPEADSGDRTPVRRGCVVVGLDGSYGSEEALRYAFEEAARTGAELVAVHAWRVPAPLDTTAFTAYVAAVDHEYLVMRADKYVRELVEEVRSEDTAKVSVRITVVEDQPAHALLAEAAGADLVVVGSRGRGGFTGLLLGSVSQTVLHHAPVPVVVVRDRFHSAR
ncbi:universal stress protein [Salinactinospora qingdaonensis]|uniref:Universal stress protein n=1 Tax=Salinactinospora qingdaonensis TaxID=702744 RepID=A0ABP7FVP6_9ACTN